jgi:arginase
MSQLVSILGIPYDRDSSFLPGCAAGPAAIRKAFHSHSTNYFSEDETDLQDHPDIRDVGDLLLNKGDDPRAAIESEVEKILAQRRSVLSYGGDHSITYPILRAFAGRFGLVNLLQFDAHPDLYNELDGNRFSHACPFARSHEDGLIGRHIQVGIRTMTAQQREQAARYGVEVVTMKLLPTSSILADGRWYITLDLDVLDPAFAPGISHHEPGGMSVRDVLSIIQSLNAQVIGADIVELNPTRDINEMTAMVAAKFAKELMTKMVNASI